MVVERTSPTYPPESSSWTNSIAGAWRACNPTTVRAPCSAGSARSGGMWAVAAQPRTGLTPMIPTPSVDVTGGCGRPGPGTTPRCVVSIWVAMMGCSFPTLEPEDLADEDHGGAARHPLLVDDENFVHAAVHAIRSLGSRVLEREDVFIDAAKCLLYV